MIYLDNAATTKVFDCSITAADCMMRDEYFNTTATYPSGCSVKTKIEGCRRKIAAHLGVNSTELFFTSCATESNNWAFNGVRLRPAGNIVISAGEHASVYEAAVALKNKGVDVRIAPIKTDGTIDLNNTDNLIDQNTRLVSCIHVSNETGAVNPIAELSQIVRKNAPRALFHSDGVQAALKVTSNLRELGVDLYTISGHKIGAPKGVGILYIKNGINLPPLLYGGGQETNRRSGTHNTPYIAALAAACDCFSECYDCEKSKTIYDLMCTMFLESGFSIVGNAQAHSNFIICAMARGIKAEVLQNLAYERGVIIGKGSSCSGSMRGNRVLSAIGLNNADVESCFRISTFIDTTLSDAKIATELIIKAIDDLRRQNVG